MSSSRRKALVIVESPAKARTISRFLGDGFVVEASIGHVRDLPGSADEIPAAYRDKPWARTAIDIENGFKPLYVVSPDRREQVQKLKKLCQSASELYLATDEDREGEAIAWHLREVLAPQVPYKRMVFHEITPQAIAEALDHPRDIDQSRVEAQEARRVIDRLVGYELSPVLWRKIAPGLSAGRVQSVAVRLVVDRERQRMRFRSASFWDLEAIAVPDAGRPQSDKVVARLTELAGLRVATGKDFDPETGALSDARTVTSLDEARARRVADTLRGATLTVQSVQERPFTQRPYAPFITSTLQQEAARKLRLPPKRTMRLAQDLYENGFITYMRTDSTNLSQQAIDAARRQVRQMYGAEFVPESPRVYAKKVKGAQEAHEAIRPAGESFRTPDQVRGELDADQWRLYDLIWKRTIASQMKDATGQRTTVTLVGDAGADGRATLVTTGRVLHFAGFLRAYVEGSDDPEAELEDQERVLPPLREGQRLTATDVNARGHETQPPARFTEASLIKELEDRGIGRPSTYAATLQTVQDREYVFKRGTALVPSFTAFAVTSLLERHFGDFVDYAFTARMEEELDQVASGEREPVPYLRSFYFGGGDSGAGLRPSVEAGATIDPRSLPALVIGDSPSGESILVRIGRYGPYLQVGESGARASLPAETIPEDLTVDRALQILEHGGQNGRVLGNDPASGHPISVRVGQYGPYVQVESGETKPRRASLLSFLSPETCTLDDALLCLSFPRTLGKHPGSGDPVVVQDGRFGPYVKSGSETRSIAGHQAMVALTLDGALELLAQPKTRAGGRSGAKALAELGAHPRTGKVLRVLDGRYGAYVSDGEVNATLPKGTEPTSVTLDQAVELIDARAAQAPAARKTPARKSTRASAPKAAEGAAPRKTPVRKSASAAAKAPKATGTAPRKSRPTTAAAAKPPGRAPRGRKTTSSV